MFILFVLLLACLTSGSMNFLSESDKCLLENFCVLNGATVVRCWSLPLLPLLPASPAIGSWLRGTVTKSICSRERSTSLILTTMATNVKHVCYLGDNDERMNKRWQKRKKRNRNLGASRGTNIESICKSLTDSRT